MFYKEKFKVPKIHTRKKEQAPEIAPGIYDDLPPLRGITLQEAIGNQEVQRMFRTGEILAKLFVSNPGDVYEQEADTIARQIISMANPEVLQKQSALKIHKKAVAGGGTSISAHTESEINSLKGKGRPLSLDVKDYFQPRFGVDLEDVRVHTDSNADRLARAVRARAFTYGNDVVFAKGEYKPETVGGKRLVAHELTHVLQQRGNKTEKKYSSIYPLIQRTTHGPETPTNAHNWKIPLPPWIAGTIAHGQIAAQLGIPIVGIPRASKVFKNLINPPAIVPYGIADLWQNTGTQVNIAEIKSTSTGSLLAQQEAAHYVRRHNEWTTRYPFKDLADQNYYFNKLHGNLLGGGILDLSKQTGTDKILGPFWGDPLKTLHIEADNLGAVVYWCTGQGLQVSPLWYLVLKKLLDQLKDMINRLKRMIEQVIEGVKPVIDAIQNFINSIVNWGAEHSKVLAFILLVVLLIVAIVLLIISILAEPATLGSSTAGVFASVMAMVIIVVGLGALIGINADNLPNATANLTKSLFPREGNTAINASDYEKGSNLTIPSTKSEASCLIGSFDPVGDFLAAAQPFLNPIDVIGGIFSNMDSVPSHAAFHLNNGINVLEQNGDSATAKYVRTIMSKSGLA